MQPAPPLHGAGARHTQRLRREEGGPAGRVNERASAVMMDDVDAENIWTKRKFSFRSREAAMGALHKPHLLSPFYDRLLEVG